MMPNSPLSKAIIFTGSAAANDAIQKKSGCKKAYWMAIGLCLAILGFGVIFASPFFGIVFVILGAWILIYWARKPEPPPPPKITLHYKDPYKKP